MFLLRVLIQHCCHCRRQSSCLFRLLKKATSIADFCCKSVFAPEQSEKQFLKLKPGDLERAVQLFGIQVQLIFLFKRLEFGPKIRILDHFPYRKPRLIDEFIEISSTRLKMALNFLSRIEMIVELLDAIDYLTQMAVVI